MRIRSLVLLGSLTAACGGGEATPDAGTNIGFNRPTVTLKANMEVSEDNWTEIGPADLTCLNTPSSDVATTVQVALSTVVRDFQSDNLVPNAAITVFNNQDIDAPFQTTAADGNAEVTFTIPIGTKRFGYKMIDDSALDTLLLNQKVDPNNPTQTEGSIRSVSKSTAQTLPALIGISRTQGTGVLAGAIRDCQDREISGFIATVTTNPARTPAEIQHAPGTDTYYFSSSVGLPVRHTQKAQGSEDGLFMIVELQPIATAYVQVWGYIDDAALDADNLQLIGELQTQVIPDTVITGSYEPLRSN
jgi:hypothetical protein